MECFGIAESRGEKRLVYAENKPWHTVIVLQTDYESQMYINTDIAKQYARSALSSIVIMLMLVARAGFFDTEHGEKAIATWCSELFLVEWKLLESVSMQRSAVLSIEKRRLFGIIGHLASCNYTEPPTMDQNKIYQNKNVYTRSERTTERANKWANHTHICFVGRGRSKTIIFINCSINSIIDFRTNRIYVVNGISLMCDVNFVFYAVN